MLWPKDSSVIQLSYENLENIKPLLMKVNCTRKHTWIFSNRVITISEFQLKWHIEWWTLPLWWSVLIFQNNHIDKVNEPTYLISLKTEVGSREGALKDVQFCCSQEQLQVGTRELFKLTIFVSPASVGKSYKDHFVPCCENRSTLKLSRSSIGPLVVKGGPYVPNRRSIPFWTNFPLKLESLVKYSKITTRSKKIEN